MGRRSDKELAEWAHEHLIYEAQQLRFAAERLATLADRETHERNMAIEGFAIHTRCLVEFLWQRPDEKWPDDLRASHFCADWHTGGLPHVLAGVNNRVGEEIVHLTYGRQLVTKDAKGWKFGAIYGAIVARLREFATQALPDRLAHSTRRELKELAEPSWAFQPLSTLAVATTATRDSLEVVPPEPGTIRFPPGGLPNES